MITLEKKGKLARRSVVLDAKAFSDSGNGTLEGYASVKNSIDSYGDTIVDGAYDGLDVLVKNGFVTFGHELSDCPIMFLTDAKEDPHGLWVKAEFHSTQEAQDVRKVCKERMDAGKSVSLSIDYYATEWEYKSDQNQNQIRVLKKVEVVGFAIVNVPAERQALATSAKSGSGTRQEEQYEDLLAELEDWASRPEWIAANRKNGLSTAWKERITAVKSRLDALLVADEEPSTPEDEEIALGAILELEQFAESLTA